MILGIPHRLYLAIMGAIGFFLVNSYRTIFSLSIAHAAMLTNTSCHLQQASMMFECPTEGTPNDFRGKFTIRTTMIFFAVFFAGNLLGCTLGSVTASRVPANKILCLCVAVEAIALCILPIACRSESLLTITFLRLICGVCDGAYQPSLVFLIGSWSFPKDKARTIAWSLMCRTLGYVTASLAISMTMCYVSWDSGFYIFGGLGLGWAVLLVFTSYAVPMDCPHLKEEELLGYTARQLDVKSGCVEVSKRVPYKAILTSKAVWSIWFGRLSGSWTMATITALQPLFFKDAFAFSMSNFGLLLSLQPVVKIVGLWCGSALSHRLSEKKMMSVTNTRKLMQGIGSGLECLNMLCIAFSTDWRLTYSSFFLTAAATGFSENGHRTNQVDLSMHYSNIVSGIGMLGMVGALIDSSFSYVIQGSHDALLSWRVLFLANSALSLACVIVYGYFASGELQPWDWTDPQKGDQENQGQQGNGVALSGTEVTEAQGEKKPLVQKGW